MNIGTRRGVITSILVLVALARAVIASPGTYSGGTGEPNDPYRIATAEDLNDIGNHIEDFNKCFILVNDINMSDYQGATFNMIGIYISKGDPNNKPFTGVFDGNGRTIMAFAYNDSERDAVGLFRYVTTEHELSIIKGVRLVDVNVQGRDYVGALMGLTNGGWIQGSYVSGRVLGDDYVGGFVGGATTDILIWQCTSEADVSGDYVVGGLAGRGNNIYECLATGTIGGFESVGGLLGQRGSGGYVWCCAAHGDVSGMYAVGGLIGDDISITRSCYASGSVYGAEDVGGLVGYARGYGYSGNIPCFWDREVNPNISGLGNIPDGDAVIGETTSNMKKRTTYTDQRWDFVGESVNGPGDYWTIKEGVDYPELVWERVNLVGWYEVDFADLAAMANWWGHNDCGTDNDCNRTDIDFSGAVDVVDLAVLCNYWVEAAELF